MLHPSRVKKFGGVYRGFVGLTLKGTPTSSRRPASPGLDQDEADTVTLLPG